MEIVLTRIDDRLVHGQITTAWTRQYHCDMIYVIDEQTAKDPLLKRILKATAPPDIKVEALTVGQAVELLNDNANKGKVMILTKGPESIVRLVENNVPINAVNVGGMQPKAGTKKISKAVSVADDDIKNFKKLASRNVKIEIKMIPTENGGDLISLI